MGIQEYQIETTLPSILHVWELYMPGHFIEPHRYLASSRNVPSHVVAAIGANTENSSLPNVHYYSKSTAIQATRPGFWRRNLRRAFSPVFWNQYNRFCCRVAHDIQPQLIHAHFGTTAARILPTLRRYKVPAVASFYGFDASASLRSRRWRNKYAKMLPRFDRLIVLCPEVKERLINVLGCNPEKVVLWMLPGGIEEYPYRRRKTGNGVRFITAARFAEKKGHPSLLQAFRGFVDEHPEASLTLIGYGPLVNQVEDQIIRLNLQRNTRLIDTKAGPGFPALYYRELLESDIFILPSITAQTGDDEAGPSLTMVCAQASGLPVICTPWVGVGLSMREGQTGYYCESNNPEDLLAKMKLLSSQPEKWGPMGKAGSDLVQSEFSVDGQMKKLRKVYADTIRESCYPQNAD